MEIYWKFVVIFPSFDEDLFFGLHLICSPEKNRGRGSYPQS